VRRSERQGALTRLRPSSCHGIVGSDRRGMTRGRSSVMGFGSVSGDFTRHFCRTSPARFLHQW